MRDFTIQDLYLYRTLDGLAGATTCARAVCAVTAAHRARDGYSGAIWLLEDGRRARRLTGGGAWIDRSPRLSADGGRVAFASDRLGDPALFALRIGGGEARRVGELADPVDCAWSPDGRELLVLAPHAIGHGKKHAPRVVDFLPVPEGDARALARRVHLHRVALRGGRARLLTDGDFDVEAAAWSPDGQRIAYLRTPDGPLRLSPQLWTCDAEGRDHRRYTLDLHGIGAPVFSPDGRRVAFSASRRVGDSISRLHVLALDDGSTWRLGSPDDMLAGAWVAWSRDARRVAAVLARRGRHVVVAFDLDSGRSEDLSRGDAQIEAFCAAGDRLAWIEHSIERPDEVVFGGWRGAAEPRVASAFNTRWWSRRRLPRVEMRTFEAPDGADGVEKIEGWLLQPPVGNPPYPLLVDVHGGPQAHALIDFAEHTYWYELCARGWAVLALNPVGSNGYGPAFARRLRGRWGELDLPQQLAAVDALRRDGIADARLALTGKSYGGFFTAWAIGHCDRFMAAVVVAPVADLVSHLGTSDTGAAVVPYALGGGDAVPWERALALSPVVHAAKATTPTLILQGEADTRCPPGQSIELFSALVSRSRAPARLVLYPGAGHGMSSTTSPRTRKDYHGRIVAWVELHANPGR